jgi:hypothetical protein
MRQEFWDRFKSYNMEERIEILAYLQQINS